jgi:hypothetical protein
MKIFKTLIHVHEDGSPLVLDAIVYEGKLWLVPEWNKGRTPEDDRPVRIISIDGLPLYKAPEGYGEAVQEPAIPLSRETLAGRGTQSGIDVIERPDVTRGSLDDLH